MIKYFTITRRCTHAVLTTKGLEHRGNIRAQGRDPRRSVMGHSLMVLDGNSTQRFPVIITTRVHDAPQLRSPVKATGATPRKQWKAKKG